MIRFADPQGVHSYAWSSLGRQIRSNWSMTDVLIDNFFRLNCIFLTYTCIGYNYHFCLLNIYRCIRHVFFWMCALRIQIWFYIIYIYMRVCFYLRVHFYKHIFWMRMVRSETSGHKQRQAIWAPLIKMRLVTSPLCYLPFHFCCWRHPP